MSNLPPSTWQFWHPCFLTPYCGISPAESWVEALAAWLEPANSLWILGERERGESRSVESCSSHTGTNLRVLLVVVKSFADEKLLIAEAEL